MYSTFSAFPYSDPAYEGGYRQYPGFFGYPGFPGYPGYFSVPQMTYVYTPGTPTTYYPYGSVLTGPTPAGAISHPGVISSPSVGAHGFRGVGGGFR
ncbi:MULTISPECIES: hypothetical protein [Bacillus]|uniref:hypothetical protein n=1 Tax=Bacillus TaxID=1386 RepID=UPI001583FBCC|nr:hypothetical protein [Bacillus glycinifermentans]MBU8786807.1 hypothetical protein [Bacillus glycinifermentans]NUJ16133.1 hypothetical protein [Bacillus glycinifermentans]